MFRNYGTTRTGCMKHLVEEFSISPEKKITAKCNSRWDLEIVTLFKTNRTPDMICNHCKKYINKEQT